MIVINRSEEVGRINGAPVFKVMESSLIIITPNFQRLSEDLQRMEMNYSTNFSKFLESYEFYFSHHLNLTHSYQREYILKKKYNVDYLDWKYSDPRFFWNKNLVKEFFDPTYSSWIVPLLDGCKKIYSLFIYGLNHFKIYKKNSHQNLSNNSIR